MAFLTLSLETGDTLLLESSGGLILEPEIAAPDDDAPPTSGPMVALNRGTLARRRQLEKIRRDDEEILALLGII
jgi:hypothetical protein